MLNVCLSSLLRVLNHQEKSGEKWSLPRGTTCESLLDKNILKKQDLIAYTLNLSRKKKPKQFDVIVVESGHGLDIKYYY